MSSPTLRALVVGAGVFGRNHLRVLRALADEGAGVDLLGVVDASPAAAARAAADFSAPAFPLLDDVLDHVKPDVAIVAVPTHHHAAVAEPLLRAGVHCLVEKPLAPSLAEAQSMLDAARTGGALLQAGHLERFNPAVTAARAHLTQPMFFEAHRLSVFTPRSLDVDVVLDLMIHDLDIVLSLVNSPVREIRAVGLPVLSRRVDIANARVRFANGCVATITASRISLKTERKMRLFSQEGYMSVDFAGRKLMMIGRERGLPLPGTGGGRLEEVTWKDHDALEAEQSAFVASVLDGAPVIVDAAAGRRALAAALSVGEAMAASRALAEASGLIRTASTI